MYSGSDGPSNTLPIFHSFLKSIVPDINPAIAKLITSFIPASIDVPNLIVPYIDTLLVNENEESLAT